ncbi:hypothetical protein [Sphingobium subterraneum]|uniref:Uncharacterized protein n=1 Tax=Sphingobium subterraneum TaxID=627688 RepID=A0A841J9A5_9SPHN|nr:hypothetical protein [Sphingobium subterraneum]MBB6125128.1 hypothetical protein [Sphingobium subterraneum]
MADIVRSDEIEVKSRLHDFGMDVSMVSEICEGAIHGRNLASGLQPKTAEGMLKYIFGVESLRKVLLSSTVVDYEIFSVSNMEGVFDAAYGRKIFFQMVDQACGTEDPQPKSKIGDGKKKLIEESGTGFLFPEMAEEEAAKVARISAIARAECWYLMVSIATDGTLCCELSHPKAVDEDKFDGFHERIKIFKYGEFAPSFGSRKDDGDDDKFEITPVIKKK